MEIIVEDDLTITGGLLELQNPVDANLTQITQNADCSGCGTNPWPRIWANSSKRFSMPESSLTSELGLRLIFPGTFYMGEALHLQINRGVDRNS